MRVTNIEKEKIILKVFINKEDIKKLIGCSNHAKAIEIFNMANELNTGYRDPKYVNVNNVLKIIGIKRSEIFANAELERKIKKDALNFPTSRPIDN